jgi:hypothetical protein
VFREDGYFNMTKAAKAFGKDVNQFHRLPSTLEYVEALNYGFDVAGKSVKIPEYWVETSMGRNGGTWGHPKLAVFFARWLDVRFSVWCDAVIEDILKGNAVLTIVKPDESAILKLSLN